MADVKIRLMSPDDLIPYENNPRHNEEAVETVMQSIKDFGFKNPVIVDKNNVIIAGHTRIKAALRLGLEKVPVIRADDLTEEQAKAYRLVDNKTGEIATWDLDLLDLELADTVWDMTPYGFELADTYYDLNPSELIDVEPEEVPEEPETQPGDIYRLGDHVLMCGDSTKEEDVNRLLDGKKADMVFTDPPYNVSIGTIIHPKFKHREIMNDSMSDDDFQLFCERFVNNVVRFTKGCVYLCGAQGKYGRVMFTVADSMMHCSTTIIWNKDQFTLGRGKYHSRYEPIWFGWVESGADFTDDRTLENVWDIPRPKASELHPTMKPIQLVATAISHNPKSKTVLDLFGGSGTTLIACEQLGRKCRMMELDPGYCDVIVRRWEKLTGAQAELINDR